MPETNLLSFRTECLTTLLNPDFSFGVFFYPSTQQDMRRQYVFLLVLVVIPTTICAVVAWLAVVIANDLREAQKQLQAGMKRSRDPRSGERSYINVATVARRWSAPHCEYPFRRYSLDRPPQTISSSFRTYALVRKRQVRPDDIAAGHRLLGFNFCWPWRMSHFVSVLYGDSRSVTIRPSGVLSGFRNPTRKRGTEICRKSSLTLRVTI